MNTPSGGLRGKCAAACLVVALAAVTAHAHTIAWTQRLNGPSARRFSAMAYDTIRGVTVLLGGYDGNNQGDTWEWNGTGWTQRMVAGPSPRWGHAMVYDATRNVTVLFGGSNGSNSLGDTWEWNGITWTQRATTGPAARQQHAMAHDSARGVTVLFGGSTDNGNTRNGETWEWNGTVWTQRPVAGPSPREAGAMAYDTTRGVAVLFGGQTGFDSTGLNGETWEWNGTAWTERMVTGPSVRNALAMAYDANRAVTVLFGGYATGYNGETWEWNGTAWTQRVASGPSPRACHSMSYDTARSTIVLVGGYLSNDSYNGETWEFGDACPIPHFTQQPAPSSVFTATTAVFTVAAGPPGSLTYQWRRNGVNLSNAPTGTGSVTTGVDTPILTISYASLPDNGSAFDCIVSNSCGSKQSNPAGLTVGPRCRTDFNTNGATDVADIFAFLTAWFAGCP